jgi:hypothetical protein
MAITDYDSLASAVKVYVARNDSTFSNQIENFISLAEDRIYNGVGDERDPMFSPAVRVKEMSETSTISITASTGTIPTGSLGIRRLSRTSDLVGIGYLAPDAFATRYNYPDAGTPRWYTIEGDQVRVAPAGWAGDISVLYYKRPTGISSNSTTNDVLTAYPNLYFTAVLFEAFSFLKDGETAQGWLGRFRSAASGVNRSASASRHGGGKLRAQPRVSMP